MVTTAVVTSASFLAAALLVLAIIKKWAKPGSSLFGAACGVLIGASVLGDRFTAWVSAGVDGGGAWLSGARHLKILGVQPLAQVPTWGWTIIFASLVVALVVAPAAAFFDGGTAKAKSKKDTGKKQS